jgi:predicted ATPase/class 3 adenylate cyclase
MYETCALLQIDIVDSTHLGQQLGDDAASALWQAHDRSARDLLPAWRGREIDKSDGFLLLFNEVVDAVGYALAYHRATAALEVPTGFTLKARAGVHVGPVIKRENPSADVARGAKPLEVEGVAKPTTARVMAIARPGQTLLSAAARAALGAAPSLTSARVQGHGHWRLKGLLEPMELFEVGDADAPFEPPPDSEKAYRVVQRAGLWLPLREVRHSLPAERDAFVGRREALQDLARRFEAGARLVSVFGIGGTGKTRFVQRFGWTWLGDYPGGVWFCDLSQATSLDGILHSVGQGLDVPLSGGDPGAQLGHAIAGRGQCLVILDNFEQVANYAEGTVGRWLDAALEARFIVTTREVLGIVGEDLMSLTPLDTKEAMRLFRCRISGPAGGNVVHLGTGDVLQRIVDLLDGLPLAIELAAARARVLPLATVLDKLSNRFELLKSHSGGRNRQATLKATLDWSWDLLTVAERMALSQLSVFEGGFTLKAADAVLNAGNGEKPVDWTMEIIERLADRSLIRRCGEARFDLLLTVQAYASERLSGDSAICGMKEAELSTMRRHFRFYSGFDERSAVADRCADAENLVAACRRAVAMGDAHAAMGALLAAWSALKLRGPFSLSEELFHRTFAMPNLTDASRIWIYWIGGMTSYALGHQAKARERINAGLDLSRRLEDWLAEATLSCDLGDLLLGHAEFDQAEKALRSALDIAERLGDLKIRCHALSSLGVLLNYQTNDAQARCYCQAALLFAEELGDVRRVGGIHGNLGMIEYSLGNEQKAQEHYRQALESAISVGDRPWEGNARCNLGLLLHEFGDSQAALSQLLAALEIARQLGNPRLECVTRCNLGLQYEAREDWALAQEQYETAIAVARDLGDRRAEGQFLACLGLLYTRVGRNIDALSCFDRGEKLLTEIADQTSLGLLLCNLAQLRIMSGELRLARRSVTRASSIAKEIGAAENSGLWKAIAKVLILLKQSLSVKLPSPIDAP